MTVVHRNRIYAVFALLGVLAFPASPRALDLGLTPSHVYSLWANINESLIAATRTVSSDTNRRNALTALKPNQYSGKKPADVFVQVGIYREKLNRLLLVQNLPLAKQVGQVDGTITPSNVFLNSGHVLNAQVRWLIVMTGKEQTVSQFYERHEFSGKTPSDVYGLVDLANRRMDMLLGHANL